MTFTPKSPIKSGFKNNVIWGLKLDEYNKKVYDLNYKEIYGEVYE